MDGFDAFGDQPTAFAEGVDPSPPLPEGAFGFVDGFQPVDQPLDKLQRGGWGLDRRTGVEVDEQNVGRQFFGFGLGGHLPQQAALAHPAQAKKAGVGEERWLLAQVVRAAEPVQQLIDDFVPSDVGQIVGGFRHCIARQQVRLDSQGRRCVRQG